MSEFIKGSFQWEVSSFQLAADFEAPRQGVTAIFGHSGAGKTSLLRCMAGLLPAEGHISIGNKVWLDSTRNVSLPVHKRNLGYVFQGSSLFAHLTVKQNLAYGLNRLHRFNGISKFSRDQKIESMADNLGIAHLLERNAMVLSGGEQQIVAIGRALLTDPSILLMDEPLASIDRVSRNKVLSYLQKIKGQLDLSIFYVSHSVDEVLRLADHGIWVVGGEVKGCATISELLEPLGESLDNPCVLLSCTYKCYDHNFHLSEVKFKDSTLYLPWQVTDTSQAIVLKVAAEDVSITRTLPTDSSILNILPGQVRRIKELDGPDLLVSIDCHGTEILANITKKSAIALSLRIGLSVFVQVNSFGLYN